MAGPCVSGQSAAFRSASRATTEDDVTQPREQIRDRRVRRTRQVLREALQALIREKSYDSIAVQDILDRANVGRSTFYAHYHDKDELLASGIHDILGPAQAPEPTSGPAARRERILSFSLPMLEHVDGHRRLGAGGMGTRGRAVLHGHLRRVLTESIADALRADSRHRGKTGTVPPDLLARYLASTFVVVLNWWVESRSQIPPIEVDDVFRELVLPTLTAAGV
jgi:AcrR family transcriptional regulator